MLSSQSESLQASAIQENDLIVRPKISENPQIVNKDKDKIANSEQNDPISDQNVENENEMRAETDPDQNEVNSLRIIPDPVVAKDPNKINDDQVGTKDAYLDNDRSNKEYNNERLLSNCKKSKVMAKRPRSLSPSPSQSLLKSSLNSLRSRSLSPRSSLSNSSLKETDEASYKLSSVEGDNSKRSTKGSLKRPRSSSPSPRVRKRNKDGSFVENQSSPKIISKKAKKTVLSISSSESPEISPSRTVSDKASSVQPKKQPVKEVWETAIIKGARSRSPLIKNVDMQPQKSKVVSSIYQGSVTDRTASQTPSSLPCAQPQPSSSLSPSLPCAQQRLSLQVFDSSSDSEEEMESGFSSNSSLNLNFVLNAD